MSQEELVVELKRGKSKPFWLGHPWIFSGAIHKVRGEVGETGGPCIVVDERKNAVATGYYNPHGRISVRILEHRRTTDDLLDPQPFEVILRQRVEAAQARRRALGFPNEETDVYRVVNAEGDLLPGLVVDRLGEVASVQLNSRLMYERRAEVASVVAEILEVRIVAVAVTETASRFEGIPVLSEVYPDDATLEGVEVRERGVRYRVDLSLAQKTGFYCDQRDNRHRFAALTAGHRVLDAYCYVGGFGISAALAGAAEVVAVDGSRPAVEQAVANAALNGVSDRFTAHIADAVTFLKEAHARGERFDRIVCDPPKLAQGRSHLEDALKKYARINTLALGALNPGGLLLTCSCSRHIDPDAFARMLTEAGHRLRRPVQVFEAWGQPADHPSLTVAPEGRYLKAFLVGLG